MTRDFPGIPPAQIYNSATKTYEQFILKDQPKQSQQILVDSYAAEADAYGDIGVSKGYGPCSYKNADCVCYIEKEKGGWIQLYIGCPAEKCEGDKKPSSWVHAKCGSRFPIYINNKLHLKCINCDKSKHMKNWAFDCGQHNHPGDYKEASAESFLNALSIMGNKFKSRNKQVRDKIREIVIKAMDEWSSDEEQNIEVSK